MMTELRIACIGDVVGVTGRSMFQKHIAALKQAERLDAIIVNGENSSLQGRGITSRIVRSFRNHGADIVTSGNHIWYKKEIYGYLQQHQDLLRPANFPSGAPGVGVTTFTCKGHTIGVINVQGRVFMKEQLEDPFRTVESLISYLKHKTRIIIVDMHAEVTSEKMAMGHFLDGKVTGVVGTHTHVQTADERILPGGTAFITDLGMVGSLNGMLGMKKEPILQSFLTQMPTQFSVDTSLPVVMSGVIIHADVETGMANQIRRIRIIDNELVVDAADEE